MGGAVSVLLAIFRAIAATKALADYAKAFAAEIVLWYVERERADALSKIADAAALAARAQTDEERYHAAQKWQEALNRPRVFH